MKNSGTAGSHLTDLARMRDEMVRRFPSSERFGNRELRWLDFNTRVLEEAMDRDVPVLERLKFLAIVSSNLDEFFMVRVAGLRREIEAGLDRPGVDGLTPSETMGKIAARVHECHEEIGQCLRTGILPDLQRAGVLFVTDTDANEEQRAYAY